MQPAGGTSPAPVIIRPSPPVEVSAAEVPEMPLTVTVKTSGVGARKTIRRKAGVKCPLPSVKNYAWEKAQTSGAWECWFTPERASERGKKSYVGYVGKKLLAEWLSQSEDKDELRQLVKTWIREKEAARGNSLARVSKVEQKQDRREKRGEL